MELKAHIHSVETCGTVDGPGLRYVAFFQGCKLRCKYCHNPDTWKQGGGTLMTVSEILEDALKYKSYMRFSGGGFTASGGDPVLQHKFVAELFKRLKENGVHTALDTSGYAETSDIEELISYTDLVLLDIKSIIPEKYFDLTAVKLEYTLKFAEFLSEKNIPVWIRYVVVPGLTDEQEDVTALAQYLKNLPNLQKVELLPFHKLGEHKWETMNLPYKLRDVPVPGKDVMKNLEGIIKSNGLPM